MVGLRLPLQTHPLQALVSELLEPVLNCVVMSNAVHVYVSQAHKGELVMGAGIDTLQLVRPARLVPRHRAADRRGARAVPALQPRARAADVGRPRRRGAGRVADHRSHAHDGLYINCGWGTGGFKATPGAGWVLAHTIAHGRAHPLAEPFALERFTSGALIDEHGAAAVAH